MDSIRMQGNMVPATAPSGIAEHEIARFDQAEDFFHEIYKSKTIRPTRRLYTDATGFTRTTPMTMADRLMNFDELPMDRRAIKLGEVLSHTEAIQHEIDQAVISRAARAIDERYGKEYDAISGQKLDPQLVSEGRLLEMQFLQKWQVYTYVTYAECH